jgi:hypothetical protein
MSLLYDTKYSGIAVTIEPQEAAELWNDLKELLGKQEGEE